MGSVAVLAGVSPRTLYRHYGSKSALFAATIAAGTADFLEQLGEYVQRTTLREAILAAFTQTTLESSEESRAIMYLVVTEDEVSRYWLSTSQRMVPVLAATLRSACQADQEAEDQMVWEVRAGALLAAFNSAYRRWAVSPGSDLIELVAKAVDTVLPILTPPAIQDAPT
ncbi:MAG: Transcriptional regulator [Mycobacterium sp.]|jgi:AcrR family transcriptional regulator|nr:Transcriptional regulator [Mycobacterium sp.]